MQFFTKDKRQRASSVLDAGCGEGKFISQNPHKIVGLDWNVESINKCREYSYNVIECGIRWDIRNFTTRCCRHFSISWHSLLTGQVFKLRDRSTHQGKHSVVQRCLNMHLTRFFMYKRIMSCLEEPVRGELLGISGIKNFLPLFNRESTKITEVWYPDVDMQNLPFNESAFDFVISDQVIEHLNNPQKAIDESHRVLRKGGIAIHTTCFMNYIHPSPEDFWRFSPEALRYLCKDFSEILQCEGWGNRIALFLCFTTDKFRYMSIPENKLSLRWRIATLNEKRYPIVTWIVARK